MIESLSVSVPSNIINRDHSEGLLKFEKVTGILTTRRWLGNFKDLLIAGLKNYQGSFDVKNVIVITQTPERLSPCTAMDVVRFYNLPSDVLAFDVNHACDGWVLGVHLANQLKGKTLLVCIDMLRYAPNDLEKLIFSDCVSVTLVDPFISEFKSLTDSSAIEHLYLTKNDEMKMDGSKVFDFVVANIPKFVNSFQKQDLLCLHQANLAMLNLVASRSGYAGKDLVSIQQFGNMSMNSIPVTLAHHKIKLIDKSVLCVGFGAGFTAAGMPVRFSKDAQVEVCYV